MNDFNNDGYDDEIAISGFTGMPNTKQQNKKEYLLNGETDGTIAKDNKTNHSKVDQYKTYKEHQKTKEESGQIKIDISSVEKLTGALKFAAANLDKSVKKVDKIEKLSEVLNLLQSIDQHKYYDFFEKFEDKINLSKIDQKVEKKINFVLNKKVKQIDDVFAKSSSKFQQYAEIFEDPDVIDVFQEISDLKKFRKKFKFKSIILSSIITALVTLTASYLAYSQLYNFKIKAYKHELYSNNKKIMSVMQYAKNVKILENNKAREVQFTSPKMQLYLLKDGTMAIEVSKM